MTRENTFTGADSPINPDETDSDGTFVYIARCPLCGEWDYGFYRPPARCENCNLPLRAHTERYSGERYSE